MFKPHIVALALLLGAASMPAFAQDQTLLAEDNGEVNCTIARNGLTRISLLEDRFASVTKMTTGLATDDFTVVNEPTRGDIYISLPQGYARPTVSFFGTTSRGFVYKFACSPEDIEAHQVFVENRSVLAERDAEDPAAVAISADDQAIALVEAMYGQLPLEGYETRQLPSRRVAAGDLRVQMLVEYRGTALRGRSLRIRNDGETTIMLDEQALAPPGAMAFSVTQNSLDPGETTTAFVVLPEGAAR